MEVKFVGSFKESFPRDGRRHVVFIGRSNVGKSSLINMLVGTKVAQVSKEPGRTRSVNFFLIEKVYLVDLPGYGFAKVSKREREEWKRMIESYFMSCWEDIKIVFLLVDCLVGPTDLDVEAIRWIEAWKLPYLVVLTKCDRANQGEIQRTLSKLRNHIKGQILITSSKEGKGKREIGKYVFS
ncbi:MAG: ribosome biogenesis GTP-binding protein YihA/YsxC [Aquificaceae bacterium]